MAPKWQSITKYYVFDSDIYENPERAKCVASIQAHGIVEALEIACRSRDYIRFGYVLACQQQTTEFVGDVAGLFPINEITVEIMRRELDRAMIAGIDENDILSAWIGGE